jgi:hypothetical protein
MSYLFTPATWLHNMFQKFQNVPSYHKIDLVEPSNHDERKQPHPATSKKSWRYASLSIALLLCLTAGWTIGVRMQHTVSSSKMRKPHGRCESSYVRREWRSLSTSEKADYIQAVKCLVLKPSKARSKGSLYDDYPYTHARVGGYCKFSWLIFWNVDYQS